MFFNEVFTGFHFCQVEGIDFGNFGDKIRVEFNSVVIGAMGRKMIMSFLRKDICEVFAPFGYEQLYCLGSLCDLSGDSGLVN